MTTEDIKEAVEQAKETALHYLALDKKVFYKIRVVGKFGAREYDGDNKDDRCIEKFCNQLDSAVVGKGVSTIQITLRDNHKEIEANIPTIMLQQEIIQPQQQPQPQQDVQKNGHTFNSEMMNLFGMAFGFQGLGSANDQFGSAGVLMTAQRQTMEREFAQREQDKLIGELKEKVATMTARIAELEEENDKLYDANEKLEDQMADYKEIKAQLEDLQTSHGKIANVGAAVLSGMANTFIASNPMLRGLFGIDDNSQAAMMQSQQAQMQAAAQSQEQHPQVEVEPDDDEEEEGEQAQKDYYSANPLMTV